MSSKEQEKQKEEQKGQEGQEGRDREGQEGQEGQEGREGRDREERNKCTQAEGVEEVEEVGEVGEVGDEEDEGDELYEHFNFKVDPGQSLLRIDLFLTNRMENTSRNRIQIAAESGSILVNGTAVRSNYKVKPLDEISIVLPYPKRELEIIAQDIPLDIIYEDDYVLVVNKEAGMVVHPGHGNYTGTLINALTYHLKNLPLFQEGDMRAGLVHRIDKDTSGLLVIAKTEKAHSHLAKQFFARTVGRRYLALVWGRPEPDQGTITGNIGRSVKDRLRMCVFKDGSEGKHAVTHYRLVRSYGYVTLQECQLETGRTHQIRVHMEWIGHPLFNDERYGGNRILRGQSFSKYKQFVENCFRVMPRQGLHAASLEFIHPHTEKSMHFEVPLPKDMATVLEKWEVYSNYHQTLE